MTITRPSLTIAIPTYNRAHKVSELAQSILKQMHPDEELLIIDDGSSDNTYEILNAIPRIRVHRHIPNQGMVKTWNSCLKLASNDWICIIHDDDILCDKALDAIRSACSVAGEPSLILHTQELEQRDERFIYQIFSPGPSAVFRSATSIFPSGAVIHRNIVGYLGAFDEELSYSADIEYFARVTSQYKLLIIESPAIVAYQLHNDNYQYKTWMKSDFFPQLVEIERRVVAYSGMEGAAAVARQAERMRPYLNYIIGLSEQLGNRMLMRKYGLLLWRSPGYGRRMRLRGFLVYIKSWLFSHNSHDKEPYALRSAPLL